MLLLALMPLLAAPPPQTVVALWTTAPPTHGEVPEAMPPRFVLLEDGQVFVGGTSEVASGRLSKGEAKAIERQVEKVQKLPGITTSPQTLGPGDRLYRLSIRKTGDVVAKGDPARATGNLRTLALLVQTLMAFDHPSLRPIVPPSFAVSAREARIPAGCRSWVFPMPLAAALKQPQVVPAAAAVGWPTGGDPAFVCDSDRQYVVTLRPLLPGETP